MQICIHGSDYVSVAAILSEAGCDVHFIADDDCDAARLTAFCIKNNVTLTQSICGDVHLGIGGLSLDWRKTQTALRITRGTSGDVLVEIQGDPKTGNDLGRALGCRVIPTSHVPLTAWFEAALSACCETLMLRGASPAEIDAAATDMGFALGPLAMQDRDGVQSALLDRAAVFDRLGHCHALPLFKRAVCEGRLGRVAGVGWYRYPGGVGPVEDPLVEDLAAEEAHFFGVAQDMPTRQTCVTELSNAMRSVSTAAKNRDADFVIRHLFGQGLNLT